MSADCIFCQIIKGQAPSFKVYEDEVSYAFMDIFPMGDGHTLVIPKHHAANLFELPEQPLSGVVLAARKVARAIREALGPDGLMVAQLNGAAAGQTVFHYHMHLIPKMEGDPLGMKSRGRADDAHLARQAEMIIRQLEQA